MAAVDVDGDGDGTIDLITAHYCDDAVVVLLGKRDGAFQTQRSPAARPPAATS